MFVKKKVTLKKVEEYLLGVQAFVTATRTTGVSPLLGFKMSEFKKKLEGTYESFTEEKKKLLEKYGVETEEGSGAYTFEEVSEANAYNDALEGLLEKEVDVEVLSQNEKITMRELAGLKLPVDFMSQFSDFIQPPKKKNKKPSGK